MHTLRTLSLSIDKRLQENKEKYKSEVEKLLRENKKYKAETDKRLQEIEKHEKKITLGLPQTIELQFNSSGTSGLFNQCTQILRKPYSTSGLVSVTASSISSGDPTKIIEFGNKNWYTDNTPNSYVTVHLKKQSATVTGYLIQPHKDFYPRNWRFE